MFNFKTSKQSRNARVDVNWNGMSRLEVILKWLHFQFTASEKHLKKCTNVHVFLKSSYVAAAAATRQ